MSLYKKIQDDIKEAMKSKDVETLDTLRLVYSALKNKVIDLKRDLEDVEVVATLRSDVKKLHDALKDFEKAERRDLMEKAKKEIELLKKYLPAEMSDEELKEIVTKKMSEMGAKHMEAMGKVIGAVMVEIRDKVDGGRVKEMVEKLLQDRNA